MRYTLTSLVISMVGALAILILTFSPTQSSGQPSAPTGPTTAVPGAPKPAAPADSETPDKAGPEPAGKAEFIGAEACLACHGAGYAKGWLQQPHGRFLMDPHRTKDGKGCEECHGPGSLHAANPPGDILSPNKLSARRSNAVCLQCHKSQIPQHDWQIGPHAMANVRCSDCHKVHQTANDVEMLAKPKNQLCFDCHKNIQTQLHQNSHHPVLEGKVDCSDCHNVHSGAHDGMLVSDEKTTCTRCHADVQGPFVFEHDVTVNGYSQPCTVCHQPHGSPNVRLYRFAGNGLCLQCHTSQAVNHFPGNCVSCHTHVHGSNNEASLLR